MIVVELIILSALTVTAISISTMILLAALSTHLCTSSTFTSTSHPRSTALVALSNKYDTIRSLTYKHAMTPIKNTTLSQSYSQPQK